MGLRTKCFRCFASSTKHSTFVHLLELILGITLLKHRRLANLVLDHCKYSLYHSYQEDYAWQDVPKLPKKSAKDAIFTWAEMVTQNHERLGGGPSDFFAAADFVSDVLCTKGNKACCLFKPDCAARHTFCACMYAH